MAAIGDMGHHHSFQQDDTTPSLENPYEGFCSGCRPPATAEHRGISRKRSRKKDLRADAANDHHDAELSRDIINIQSSVIHSLSVLRAQVSSSNLLGNISRGQQRESQEQEAVSNST